MPPNSARVTSTVRAPRSALRRAASTPAGPAPITTMSPILAVPRRSGLGQSLLRPLETDIVGDDGARSYGQLLGICHAQSDEGDFVFPDRSQELLEELHGEKLPGAAAIAESERRVAGCIDHRACLTVNYGIHSTKRTVGQLRLAPVSDCEGFFVEGTLRQSRLPAFGLVIIHSRRGRFVAIWIELFWIAPVPRVCARFQVWGNDEAVRRAQQLPLPFHRGNAAGIGGDCSEQLHHKPIEWSK